MRFILRLLRILLKVAVIIVGLATAHSLILCPYYDFTERSGFRGSNIYNPYDSITPNSWKKANFHAHSKILCGITNGRSNSSEKIESTYNQLGYDIIGISDYMRINNSVSKRTCYIPMYEHGYGITKAHQLVIGANSVNWLDYPIISTIQNKQYVLDQLHQDDNIVAIAHPTLRNAYSSNDLKQLDYFNHIEIYSSMGNNTNYWDSLLSSGNPIFALGNDDCHDLKKANHFGVAATFINCVTADQLEVINSLKKGSSFVVVPIRDFDDDLEKKKARLFYYDDLELIRFTAEKDSLKLEFNKNFCRFKLYGQHGTTYYETSTLSKEITLPLKKSWTYLRGEIELCSGDMVYLNPIFKTENGAFPEFRKSEINWTKTFLYRGFYMLVFLVISGFLYKFYLNKSNSSI